MLLDRVKLVKLLPNVMVIALFSMGLILSRCAVIKAPTGGPMDSLPPVVLHMDPEFGVKNFDKKRIYVEFNEYVQLKDIQKELYTSPMMKKKPTATLRGRGIQIDIQDTLLKDQTYSINFGNAIVDNNEGNPLSGFRYVFSTGETIDSLIMSGYTVDGFKQDSVSKSFIMFYDPMVDSMAGYDSVLFNAKALAVGRSENNGIFIAQNLQDREYKIYAFQDKNSNQTYDPGVDKVGFLDSTYNPADLQPFNIWYDTVRKYMVAYPQVNIRMFMDKQFKRHNLVSAERPQQQKVRLQFGAPYPQIESIEFDSIDQSQIITEYVTKGRDTIDLWLNVDKSILPDTLRGSISYMKHDSLNVMRPDTQKLKLAWKYFESKEETKERERREKENKKALEEGKDTIAAPNTFKYSVKSGEINPLKHFTVEFQLPLTKVDTSAISLIRLGKDSSTFKVKHQFIQDTANLRRWILQAAWQAKGQYELMIPQGAIENIAAESNDTIRTMLKVIDPEALSTVVLNVRDAEPDCVYVLQLLSGSGSLIDEFKNVTNGTYTFKYVPVGDVQIRVLQDDNANGEWDSGDLIKRIQPERMELFMSHDGVVITTKKNWEIEYDIDLSKMFSPITMEVMKEQMDIREMEAAQARMKALQEKMLRQSNMHQHQHNH